MNEEQREREAVEAMRLAQTAIKVITDNRDDMNAAARALAVLVKTLTRDEALGMAVVLAATTVSVTEIAAEVIIRTTSDITNTAAPDWVAPRIKEDLRKFVDRAMDPDTPRVRKMMRDIFEQQAKERDQKDG